MRRAAGSFLLLLSLCCGWGTAFPREPDPADAEKEAGKAQALAEKLASETPPGTGFEGRVVREGEVVAGARVYAYRTFRDAMARMPFAASAPTADDGSWKLDVPRGKYYLVAKKRQAGDGDGHLAAGDGFAYHGSNPVTVVPGKYTHVGFAQRWIEAIRENKAVLKYRDIVNYDLF